MKRKLLAKLQWGLILVALTFSLIVSRVADSANDSDFEQLQTILINHGFVVKQEIPPKTNRYGLRPYGLINSTSKTIWINPVVFELGNARSVLIHEAVHAAQSCAGQGDFSLVDLDLEPPQFARPYFMRYHSYRREIEAQAYTVQTQPDSFAIAVNLLDQNCP